MLSLMRFSWFFVIVLLVLVAVFSVQNAEPIMVRFVVWDLSMPAAFVIQLAALLGGLVGLIVGVLSRRAPRHTTVTPPTPQTKPPAPNEISNGI